MNLQSTIEIYAGGPGSGCQGQNCGRKKGIGFVGNIDKGPLKGLAKLPDDPDKPGSKSTSFMVAPNGNVYRESDLLGPGFHEHFTHALALMQADPKEFLWIKNIYDKVYGAVKGKSFSEQFGAKYTFMNRLLDKGAIRTFCATGSNANYDAGIDVGQLTEKTLARMQNIVDSYPVDNFHVDFRHKDGSLDGVEGTGKEVMREVRKSFYGG